MGLGGFFKGLGKGLLKYVAPVAASFIPGVGPLAAMAIGGGLGAANAKVSGGGLKDVLLGAGMGAGGAKLGKGLSPSKGLVGGLKQAGMDTLRNPSTLLNIAGDVAGGLRSNAMPPGQTPPGLQGPERPERGMGGNKKRQPAIGGTARPRMDMSNPNLAHSILQGRNEFLKGRAIPTDY